jgi:DNA polymerase-3 subunit gamma/tau
LIRLNQVLADGKDVRQLMKDWIEHYRSLLMTKYIKNPEEVLNLSTENVERIRNQSERLSLPVINNSILELSKTLADVKWSTQPRVLLELAIVRLGSGDGAQPVTQRMVVQPVVQQVVQPAAPAAVAAPAQPVAQPVDDVPPWEWPEDMVPLSEPPEEAVAAATPVMPVTPEPQVEALDLELEDLWYSIFDDPSAKKGSVLLPRMGSKLHKVTDSEFFVEASNAVTKGLLKDNEALLSQLMEQKTGRKMRLVLDDGSSQAKEDSKEKKAQDLARSMEEKLGIPVEVR